jgi:hypothetical protein
MDDDMNYYALLYDVVDDFLSRRSEYRDEHLRLAREAQGRGELLLAGALADPADRALLVFRASERSVVEDFARNDPYVAGRGDDEHPHELADPLAQAGRAVLTGSWDQTARLRACRAADCRRASVQTASSDQTARRWEAATGQPLHILRGHSSSVSAVALSPNGRGSDSTSNNGGESLPARTQAGTPGTGRDVLSDVF